MAVALGLIVTIVTFQVMEIDYYSSAYSEKVQPHGDRIWRKDTDWVATGVPPYKPPGQ
jgi:hypothetical protein